MTNLPARPSPAERAGASDRRPPRPWPVDGASKVDWREQLFNEGAVGPVERVATPAVLITSLIALMYDIDPKHLKPSLYTPGKGSDANRLYDRTVRHWLDRHPVLKAAEVRHTGTGLHVLLRLDPAVEFGTDAEREKWSAIVRAVQASLPSDPNAPGLTALTRPVGAINSKTGGTVKRLRRGGTVAPAQILQYVDDLRRRPFATIAGILLGTARATPCPVCGAAASTMAALDRVGLCYARCGKVQLPQLLGAFMANPAEGGA